MKNITTSGLIALVVALGFGAPALAREHRAPGSGPADKGADQHRPAATAASSTQPEDAPGVRHAPSEERGNKKHAKKTEQGVVKSVSNGSFVLAVRDTDYTVTTDASTRIVNRTWHKIPLSDLRVGDKVRVFGVANDAGIAANLVRDISLPPLHAKGKSAEHATSTPGSR